MPLRSVISAIENLPIDQTVAMTGSLSVRGNVLPVGGVTAKVEAAVEAGLKKVIVPKSNYEDIILDEAHKDRIEIIPVSNIEEVLEAALGQSQERQKFMKRISDILKPQPKIGKGRTGPQFA